MKNSEYKIVNGSVHKTRALVGLSAVGITKELTNKYMNKAKKYSTVIRCVASLKSEKFELKMNPLKKVELQLKNH